MNTAIPSPSIEEWKAGRLSRARNIGRTLAEIPDSVFTGLSVSEAEWGQSDWMNLSPGFSPSDDTCQELSKLRSKTVLADFVLPWLGTSHLEFETNCAVLRSLVDVVRVGLKSDTALAGRAQSASERLRTTCMILALPGDVVNFKLASTFLTSCQVRSEVLRSQGKAFDADSILRTANGKLTSAGQIFGKKHLWIYSQFKLRVPTDLDGFRRADRLDVPKVRHVAPRPANFRRLLERMAELKRTDYPLYRFLVLVGWCGLRAEEALHARVSWLLDSSFHPRLCVQGEDDFLPKRTWLRRALILQSAFDILRGQNTGKFLVADQRSERWRAYQAALDLLEEVGFEDRKLVHYCRRIYFTSVSQSQPGGLEEARASVGHAGKDVGLGHYLLHEFTEEHLNLWITGLDR